MRKQVVSMTLEPEQVALIWQFGKDHGCESQSQSLRMILRDWQRLKANQSKQLVDTHPEYCPQANHHD